jgi:hypothetical protein
MIDNMLMKTSILWFVSDAMMGNMYIFHETQNVMAYNSIYINPLWIYMKQLNGQNLTTYWYSSIPQLLIILDDMILVLIGD